MALLHTPLRKLFLTFHLIKCKGLKLFRFNDICRTRRLQPRLCVRLHLKNRMKSKKKRSGSISTTPVRKSRNMPDQDNREPIEINGSTVTFAPSVETESEIIISQEFERKEMDEFKLVLKAPASESDVTWWKDDKEISSECIDDTDLNERTMTIPNVEIDDSGVYRVKGPNFDLKLILIVTRESKFINQPPRFIEKIENQECSLPYNFSQKLWKMEFFKGEQLEPSGRVVITKSGGIKKLVIHRLEESDSGEYHAVCGEVPSRPTKIVVKKRPLSAEDPHGRGQGSSEHPDVKEFLSDDYLLKLSKEIGAKEREPLGTHLRIKELTNYETSHPRNLQGQVFAMLKDWKCDTMTDTKSGEKQVRFLGDCLAKIRRADLKSTLLKDHKLVEIKK
ncbi:uncharacterized protein LOC110990579 [Acanthaster planci]|uniref:Uncharacterized protein LOC110990579 n=1 Tax=Acanthaster planci TaxID=133434 RepID=A0A8B8A5U2_ACAPL|nr:uncharacterized protein LOC110990579 [Acanthaster planci]